MPHSKCVACKTRLYSAASPPDLVGDLCPECGSLLEPVDELAEIVGYRSINSRKDAVDVGTSNTHQRLNHRVADLLDLQEAIHAQARLDSAPWVAAGRLGAGTVALVPPKGSS